MNFQISRLQNFKIVRQFSLGRNYKQKTNYYDSLGITPKATQGDIKTAYYKLSKMYHPDINKNNESAAEKFRDIAAAYEILGNVKSRKMYDRGLLVTGSGIAQDYKASEDEPVVETYRHASFYHHRNKPTSKKRTMGKTVDYNIDEWTRAHYSDMFTNAWEKKHEYDREMTDRRVSKEENQTGAQIFGLLALFILFGSIMFETNPRGSYDYTRTNLEPNEKPD